MNSSASRRTFLKGLTASTTVAALLRTPAAQPASPALPATVKSESDVGSLFPFIQRQAKSDFPLSFLKARFRSARGWRREARGKLLELLHYSPAKCDPTPEVVERVDRGDYIREKVYFNTTPDVRGLIQTLRRWPCRGRCS